MSQLGVARRYRIRVGVVQMGPAQRRQYLVLLLGQPRDRELITGDRLPTQRRGWSAERQNRSAQPNSVAITQPHSARHVAAPGAPRA
jgi:hypothetical protein